MTTEQREAIEICEHYKNILYACNYEEGTERTGQAIDTVLSLIKEQQKVAEKKDKIIDLMAQFIATLDIEEDICANVENNNCDKMALGECENCIKQYFERKAEDEE